MLACIRYGTVVVVISNCVGKLRSSKNFLLFLVFPLLLLEASNFVPFFVKNREELTLLSNDLYVYVIGCVYRTCLSG